MNSCSAKYVFRTSDMSEVSISFFSGLDVQLFVNLCVLSKLFSVISEKLSAFKDSLNPKHPLPTSNNLN